ncbi:hypothetical protein EPUS_05051 [Endocarpon pusillum Z07020]|uniref:Btz domain-containing protein n=1 Tax=Endocarpon pusillum (strain Z07020 / HMAS-L-300199) TaxID=1263415 RepID=U1HR60_ENDPU|nr:uncharacterized protein EPUS_05051 [Endocarpon pusillum Z07020]ERF72970.1 hypothetical protein EPUS_05051 [Endocarpon pusillum Z07020]
MPSSRGKKVVASRRRREDDGEEEGSMAEDLEDDSLSEGSIISNGDDDADIEPSDISEEDVVQAQNNRSGPAQPDPTLTTTKPNLEESSAKATSSKFVTLSDTNTMMNGLKVSEGKDIPVVDSDQVVAETTDSVVESSMERAKISVDPPAERSRREHLEYLKEKMENPAFVPNRGGFFLHDNRAASSGQNGFRAPARGRGRGGFIGFQTSRVPPFAEPTDQPWAHDLHESISTTDTKKPTASQTSENAKIRTTTALRSSSQDSPNRSFSTSILLGKVPVIIYLPGMREKVTVPNVAKKKHTLLPQHRPPLRRDKPVRISLPNQQPRYIFPSTERSFIFIPRALRPNQQGFGRGRGRSSFNPSRRTSVYGGSTYTPSIAMSRRSSLGGIAPGEGIRSPGGPVLSLPPNYVAEQGKPVVRFPPAAPPISMLPQATPHHVNGVPTAPGSVQPIIQSHDKQEKVPGALTMHQPRPQKTVSVADIESPARLTFDPPQQQQEQPFHQQMPVPVHPHAYADDGTGYHAHARRMSHASRPSGTPLSQIPERAIYAQPFHPFPLPAQAQGYLPSPYAPGAVFYPAMPGDVTGYGPSLGPSIPPAFLTGAPAPPYMLPAATMSAPVPVPVPVPAPAPAAPADGNAPAGTVAHESNGMVYYYDSSQLPPTTGAPYSASFTGASAGGVVGMGGMMTPPNHFFYPPASNGIYYTAP